MPKMFGTIRLFCNVFAFLQFSQTKPFAFGIVVGLSLSGCHSLSNLNASTCQQMAYSRGCFSYCSNLSDAHRPVSCYNLFCTNGGDSNTYGSWCSGLNAANTVTNLEIDAYMNKAYTNNTNSITNLQAYNILSGNTGTNATDKKTVNDNGLAYVMALANKLHSSDAQTTTTNIAYVGGNIGYVSGMINGDNGTNTNSSVSRYKFGYNDKGYDIVQQKTTNPGATNSIIKGVPATKMTETSNCDNGKCGGDLTQWSYKDSTSHYFERGGTTYGATILGYTSSSVTAAGAAVNGTKVFAYGVLSNFIYNENMLSSNNYHAGSIGSTNIVGGTNYLNILEQLAASVNHAVGRNIAKTDSDSINILKDGGLLNLSMPSIRDGSQVGEVFDYMRTNSFGESGISLLLEPLNKTITYSSKDKKDDEVKKVYTNATFAQGLQIHFNPTSNKYCVDQKEGSTQNYSTGQQMFAYAESVLNAMNFNKDAVTTTSLVNVIVGTGTSSYNDTEGSKSAFASTYKPWTKSENIFQSSSGSIGRWVATTSCTFSNFGSGCAFAPEYENGNKFSVLKSYKIENSTHKNNISESWVDVQSGTANAAYTGNFSSSLLSYMWMMSGFKDKNGTLVLPDDIKVTDVDGKVSNNSNGTPYLPTLKDAKHYFKTDGSSCTQGSSDCNYYQTANASICKPGTIGCYKMVTIDDTKVKTSSPSSCSESTSAEECKLLLNLEGKECNSTSTNGCRETIFGRGNIALYKNASGNNCTPGSAGCNPTPIGDYATGAGKWVYRNASGSECTTDTDGTGSNSCKLTLVRENVYVTQGYKDNDGNPCDPSDSGTENTCKQYITELTEKNVLFQGSIDYVLSPGYTVLVAAAVDTNHKTNTVGKVVTSLIDYTNAAGLHRWNVLGVNVNQNQTILNAKIETGKNGQIITRTIDKSKTVSSTDDNYNDTSSEYSTSKNWKTVTKDKTVTYHADPSLYASAVLTGYYSRLKQLAPNVDNNMLTYIMLNSSTPMWGANYTNAANIDITQLTTYFAGKSFGGTNIVGKAEVDSLNQLNSQAGRDVLVFTGSNTGSTNFDYGNMLNIDCAKGINFCTIKDKNTECTYGTPDCHPSIDSTDNCGHGKSCYSSKDIVMSFFGTNLDKDINGSFFTYNATITQDDKNTDQTNIKIDSMIYKSFFNKYADAADNPQKPGDTIGRWFDPNTVIKDEHNKEVSANSVFVPNLNDGFDIKFNYSSTPSTFYPMMTLGCSVNSADASADADSVTGACNTDYYYNAMENQRGNPTDMQVACTDIKNASTCITVYDAMGGKEKATAECANNPLKCNCPDDYTCFKFEYETGGFNSIDLDKINDYKNAIMLAVENPHGQYTINGIKVSPVVQILDSKIKPVDLYCPTDGTATCAVGQGKYYNPKINERLPFYDPNNPTGLDSSGNRIGISKSCATTLECTTTDLIFLFQSDPAKFVRGPSYVFGMGMADLQTAYEDTVYYQLYFSINNSASRLRDQIMNYFYNPNCAGSNSNNPNCGVSLSGELGFNYIPSTNTSNGVLNGTTDNNNRVVVGWVSTIGGNVEVTANQIQNIGSRSSYLAEQSGGMLLSFMMGMTTQAMNMAGYKQLDQKTSFGGHITASAPNISSTINYGNKVINTREFQQAIAMTPMDRNSDQYGGYSLESGISALQSMVSGVRYTQQATEKARMSMSFFGNKNMDDLINQNAVAAKVNNSSLYMLTTSQEGMFGNTFLRFAGRYLGSAYSTYYSMDNGLAFRFSTFQASNPLINIFSFGGTGAYSNAASLQQLGFGTNNGNNITEAQVMYTSADKKSSYSLSFGLFQDINGYLFGSNILVGSGTQYGVSTVSTPYFELKGVQHLGMDFYAMARATLSFSSINTPGYGLFSDFSTILGFGWSVGLFKDKILGGALFVTYTQPFRVVSGTAKVNLFDQNGKIINAGHVNFANNVIEHQVEAGYVYTRAMWSVTVSGVFRQNPYFIVGRQDGIAMVKANLLI